MVLCRMGVEITTHLELLIVFSSLLRPLFVLSLLPSLFSEVSGAIWRFLNLLLVILSPR